MTSRAATSRKIDVNTFLSSIRRGRRTVVVGKKNTVYKQGARADAIFFVKKGKVRLSIASPSGIEVMIGTISHGNFFGEGSLAGQPHRMSSATAMTDCQLVRVEKKAMLTALRREPTFSVLFVDYLLVRKIHYEEDLIGHLLDVDEKKLARALLLLANIGRKGPTENAVLKINAVTLAGMIGATRSRVNVLIKQFKKLGFIQDKNGLQVHNSLINVVLRD
jgi:CRP/FNR family cyclic AMP-dependent transcriptional regulator